MKTTLILKDELVRKAKSQAALLGCSMSKYMEDCLEKSFLIASNPMAEDSPYKQSNESTQTVCEGNQILAAEDHKKLFNVIEAQNQFSALVDLALSGEPVVIRTSNQQKLRLSPIVEKKPLRKLGTIPDLIVRMGDNFNDSFDDCAIKGAGSRNFIL